ncbi:hypothetical protein V6N13_041625 [Hibiscus sabdariffa]
MRSSKLNLNYPLVYSHSGNCNICAECRHHLVQLLSKLNGLTLVFSDAVDYLSETLNFSEACTIVLSSFVVGFYGPCGGTSFTRGRMGFTCETCAACL